MGVWCHGEINGGMGMWTVVEYMGVWCHAGMYGGMVPWGHVWGYGAVVGNMVPWWDVYGYGAMVAYLGVCMGEGLAIQPSQHLTK